VGEALELSRETQQPRYEAILLPQLALLASERGEFDDAERYYEEGLTIHKREKNQADTAAVLVNFSDVLRRQQKFDQAREKLEESRQLFTGLDDKRGIAMTAIQSGVVQLEAGRIEEVRISVQEGKQIAQEIGDRRWEMNALSVLARLAGTEGNLVESRNLFLQCVTIATEINEVEFLYDILYHYGVLLNMWGEYTSAYPLLVMAGRALAGRRLYLAARVDVLLKSIQEILPSEIVQQLEDAASSLSCREALQSFAPKQ
jgi:tetratricopeptide (TPR) repeat protein